jgi:hypothetical protein
MKTKIFFLMGLCLILSVLTGCGVQSSVLPATTVPVRATPTVQPEATDASDQEISPTATEVTNQEAETGCENYLQFCVTSSISGTVTTSATAGTNNGSNKNCTTWAAAGATRILELPMMLAAGPDKVTVALARIGQYTGPGQYELKAVSTQGLTDTFPAVEAAGQTYSNGEGSSAVVTIAADGSGSIQAVKLVQVASVQVTNPDPAARIDFAMKWTCQDIQ